jgi:hypothetical protein
LKPNTQNLILNLNYVQNSFVIAVIFLFFFIFGPSIDFLPITTARLAWGAMFIFCAVKFLSGYKPRFTLLPWGLLIVIFLLSLLSALSLGFNVLHGTSDYTLRNAYLGIVIESLIGSLLYYFIFLKGKSFFYFIKLVSAITLVQVFIIFVMLIDSSVREFIHSISINTAEALFERYGGFRGLGFAHSLTYDLAIFISISQILIFYNILINKEIKNVFLWVVIWLVLFLAIILTGRSGLLGAFLSLLLLFFAFTKYRAMKTLFYICLLFILTFYLLLTLFYDNPVFQRIYNYGFELFINFSNEGSFSTRSSTTLLQRMYFFSDNNTFFFGDGYWNNPFGDGYYMHTDAGFMRHVLFYGVFPSFLLYLVYLYIFFTIARYNKNNIIFIIMVFSILLIFIAGQFKGNFLVGSAMNIKFIMIFFIFSLYERLRNKRKCRI